MSVADTAKTKTLIQEAGTRRQLLFISHANPQDNAAAAWFATQLTLMGYEVWCDLKDTHGGESGFWLKVQNKIEREPAKFIFILSDTSRDLEKKKGVYKELQAADNTGRENFIIPLRIEKLTGRVPIMIGPDIYINSENWIEGLRELQERLEYDRVPRRNTADLERIASWWPAISAQEALFADEESELVSNIFRFKAPPAKIHFLKVRAENNLLAGRERLGKALPQYPAHSAHSDYAITFGCAHDYLELTHDLDIEDSIILQTADFLKYGHPPLAIAPQTARNIVTYLIAVSLEKYLGERGLESKSVGRSPRKIWYPAYGLIKNNRHSVSEPGTRKAPVSFVGTISHYRKKYFWHFGLQPIVDLHTHHGVVFSPKVVLSNIYRSDRGERPQPINEKKAVKKLGWWNKEWRRKILGLVAWLSDDQASMRIPAGYQNIVVSSVPNIYAAAQTYREKDDDTLMKEILEWADA
jgi:hypothetical protein